MSFRGSRFFSTSFSPYHLKSRTIFLTLIQRVDNRFVKFVYFTPSTWVNSIEKLSDRPMATIKLNERKTHFIVVITSLSIGFFFCDNRKGWNRQRPGTKTKKKIAGTNVVQCLRCDKFSFLFCSRNKKFDGAKRQYKNSLC